MEEVEWITPGKVSVIPHSLQQSHHSESASNMFDMFQERISRAGICPGTKLNLKSEQSTYLPITAPNISLFWSIV